MLGVARRIIPRRDCRHHCLHHLHVPTARERGVRPRGQFPEEDAMEFRAGLLAGPAGAAGLVESHAAAWGR